METLEEILENLVNTREQVIEMYNNRLNVLSGYEKSDVQEEAMKYIKMELSFVTTEFDKRIDRVEKLMKS